uniref:Zona pellucida sperm-binding protein 4 n=1 Tax=Mastacembelus armatus TaxID=205130 RepID=A0A3Q3LWI1_9TELE
MALFKCLFGVMVVVVVSFCDFTARAYWTLPLQEYQPSLPSQLPQQPKVPLPEHTFDKCQLEEHEKIQCGASDITAEQCQTIKCCFNGQQCYYGRTVTVQCTRDGQFVVIVARHVILPYIDVDSISLLETNDPSCSPVGITSAFSIFQFPVTACGTTEEEGYVVYENHMSSSYEVGIGPRGSITRDSHFDCILLLPEEAAYSSFYTPEDYPITKVLKEPVYVEVRILERSDPNIILNLEYCWATANPSPRSLPQWDLLVNGCPYHDDRYLTTVVPVDGSSGLLYPTHHKRFIIKMFTFVDQNTFAPQNSVFIHCSTVVCYPSSTNSCEHSCHRQRRSVAAVMDVSSQQKTLVSSREVILIGEKTTSMLNTKLKT